MRQAVYTDAEKQQTGNQQAGKESLDGPHLQRPAVFHV